jgi:hypothetical protein
MPSPWRCKKGFLGGAGPRRPTGRGGPRRGTRLAQAAVMPGVAFPEIMKTGAVLYIFRIKRLSLHRHAADTIETSVAPSI